MNYSDEVIAGNSYLRTNFIACMGVCYIDGKNILLCRPYCLKAERGKQGVRALERYAPVISRYGGLDNKCTGYGVQTA